jgi:hypothetical protein
MRGLRFAKKETERATLHRKDERTALRLKKEAERATFCQDEAERPTLRRQVEETIEVGYEV